MNTWVIKCGKEFYIGVDVLTDRPVFSGNRESAEEYHIEFEVEEKAHALYMAGWPVTVEEV